MKRKIKILNIIASVFLVFQILAYLGNINKKTEEIPDLAGKLAYYFGFNLPLIISVILYWRAYYLKKKLKQKNEIEQIESIGKSQ